MRKQNLIFLLGILFLSSLTPATPTNTTLLNDTFESGNLNLWTDNGVSDWDFITTISVSPTHSIEASSEDNDLLSDDLDMSDAEAIYISFSYYVSGIDDNDNVFIYYWNGSTYNSVLEIGTQTSDQWNTFSAKITDSQYFNTDFHIYIEGSSIDANEYLALDDALIIKEYTANTPPELSNITASHSIISGGSLLTIYANTTSNGVNDTEADTLYLYCDDSESPTSSTTECTGGTTVDSTYPYALTCTFAAPSDDTNHTEYCRIYDGRDYSSLTNVSYITDSTAPSTSVTNVAGDLTPSYFDSTNDAKTDILISGEADMVCRWSDSDLVYDSMSNDCTISGATANCSVTDAVTQGFYTRYISCEDQYGSAQSTSTNLDVNFYLDYNAPTTTDNSNTNIQSPPYVVTITEQDNVDSDPTTLYCKDTTNTCTPNLVIDNGGQITFTSSNRGVNYLRYYSVDDAGKTQSTVSKTININQLPVLTSASDNATTIKGGSSVNVSTVSSEPDSQQLTLFVCDSSSADSTGCAGTQYCTATESNNVSCTFSSESDTDTHTWYAFIFDDSDEAASTNPISESYTTDSTAPSINLINPSNDSTITQTSVTISISINEPLTNAWFSLDDGATNITMSNITLYSYSYSNSSIPNGDYNLSVWANDSQGNLASSLGWKFTIDDTAGDTTAPSITVQSPSNNSYDLDGTVNLTITSDESLSWAGYKINSGTLTNLDNTSLTSWNASLSLTEGTYIISLYANDSSSNQNQANDSITIYVDLTNPSVDTFSCTDVNDSQNVTCSATISDAVGLNYAIIRYNATGSWQNSSQISLSGTSDTLDYTILSGNHSPPGFTAQIYLYDLSGRTNQTESDEISISDDTKPIINNVTYAPNTTTDLDPSIPVYINTSITEDYNISSVVLMYRNSSSSDWTSLTMSNNSALIAGSSSTINYNASFTPEEETWYFKINATDFAGNENVSSTYTLVVENDTLQNISTTISNVKSITYAQRSENNTLGNLIMNNTGDGTIDFNVSVNSSSLGSRLSINNTQTQNVNYTSIASGDATNITLELNTTDLTSGLYNYTITIVSDLNTTTYNKQVNIQTAEGPYLEVSIETYSSSVTRGQSDVEAVVRVTNLGTQDATGVYLNWSLPSIFTLTSGSTSRNLGNIPLGSSGTNTITFSVSSLATESTTTLSAIATSTNADSATDSKTITISDPIVTSSSTGGTSGTGGGGGSSGVEKAVYSRRIEIVRGEQETFEIVVRNFRENESLEDLELELTGFLSQYITYTPSKISRIGPKESGAFTVTLQIPSYKESYEEYQLKALITGIITQPRKVSKINYAETQNIQLIIQEVSNQESNLSLADAENAILEMEESGFNIEEVSRLLDQAKQKLSENRNKEALDLSEEILSIWKKAFETNELIRVVAEAIQDPKRNPVLTGNVVAELSTSEKTPTSKITGKVLFASESVVDTLNLAIVAFERGDFETADERAREARNLLILERKGNLGFFLYLYWHLVLSVAILLSLTGFLGYKQIKKSSITRRIESLNIEEENLRKLFTQTQRNYFDGKLSAGEYHKTMEQHQKRLAKIRKSRLTLRNKRIKLLTADQIFQELGIERLQVESEIKKIQKAYYLNKSISESEYKTQFKTLNERLAEIEGERTTLELLGEKKSFKLDEKKNKKILEKEVRKARESISEEGKIRIIFLKILGFLKIPFGLFKKRKEKKLVQEEKKIKEKIKSMKLTK